MVVSTVIHARREEGETQGTPGSGWARRGGIAFAAWGRRARSTLEGQSRSVLGTD